MPYSYGAVSGQATCLQVALSVLLNPQKHIVDQFHKIKLVSRQRMTSCDDSEFLLTMPWRNDREIAQFDSKQGLVQTVADNFDTQICSQNVRKSTHGLAMILTQAGCQQQPQNSTATRQSARICRLKWKDTNACNLSLGEVTVQRYHG